MEKIEIFSATEAAKVQEAYNDWIRVNGDKIKIIERKVNYSNSVFDNFYVITIFYKEK